MKLNDHGYFDSDKSVSSTDKLLGNKPAIESSFEPKELKAKVYTPLNILVSSFIVSFLVATLVTPMDIIINSTSNHRHLTTQGVVEMVKGLEGKHRLFGLSMGSTFLRYLFVFTGFQLMVNKQREKG
jgi:hypothetical protein